MVAAVLFVVVRKRRAAKRAAVAAWETNTSSKEEEPKLEEQPNLDSMLDTFVSVHSGDDGPPPGSSAGPLASQMASVDAMNSPPTAPITPAVEVATLGAAAAAMGGAAAAGAAAAQAGSGEGPAPLPADYRTLDRQDTGLLGWSSVQLACPRGGAVPTLRRANASSWPTPACSVHTPAYVGTPTAAALASGGTASTGALVNSGGSGGLVNSGATGGSGGASVSPSATPSGQRLLGGGSAMWTIDFRELKLLRVAGAGSFGQVRA